MREELLDFVVVGVGYIDDAVMEAYACGMLQTDGVTGAINVAEDEEVPDSAYLKR